MLFWLRGRWMLLYLLWDISSGGGRIVVAAPFWDLSVPAVLKVYIENISADGVTFASA